ncbi:MAG: cyanophycinase [Polyangiaceae bacterium]|nr:cyanophycinase [Polyangiaceae bacterium]
MFSNRYLAAMGGSTALGLMVIACGGESVQRRHEATASGGTAAGVGSGGNTSLGSASGGKATGEAPGTGGPSTGGANNAAPAGGTNNAAPAGGAASVASGGTAPLPVGSGGVNSNASGGNAATSLGGTFNDGAASPPVPPNLVTYVTGNDADANVAPSGPGLILMGGGTDVTAAFEWWNGLITHGDIVILRTSGADGYNNYLFDMGGADSVESMLVTDRDLANSDYVRYRVSHAEGVFMAGGDQSTYINFWKGTAVQEALRMVYARGGVIGGTSAGLAVLGEFVYSATQGSAISTEALSDPFARNITLDRGILEFPALKSVVTDTHFAQRDRFGRLVSFVARTVADGWAPGSYGVGVSEATAIVIGSDNVGHVLGSNQAYIVEGAKQPEQCAAGQTLTFKGLRYARLQAGDSVQFPLSAATALPLTVSAEGGELNPASPY